MNMKKLLGHTKMSSSACAIYPFCASRAARAVKLTGELVVVGAAFD